MRIVAGSYVGTYLSITLKEYTQKAYLEVTLDPDYRSQ